MSLHFRRYLLKKYSKGYYVQLEGVRVGYLVSCVGDRRICNPRIFLFLNLEPKPSTLMGFSYFHIQDNKATGLEEGQQYE